MVSMGLRLELPVDLETLVRSSGKDRITGKDRVSGFGRGLPLA
jgi:hypothetical protein